MKYILALNVIIELEKSSCIDQRFLLRCDIKKSFINYHKMGSQRACLTFHQEYYLTDSDHLGSLPVLVTLKSLFFVIYNFDLSSNLQYNLSYALGTRPYFLG